MTWNPYGTGGDDPSTPPGEGPGGSQVPPSSWSAQQGSGYNNYGQNAYGQSGYQQSSYDSAGTSQRDSISPAAAGAHYVPGSPARTSTGTNGVRRPGLRALAVFLVLGS